MIIHRFIVPVSMIVCNDVMAYMFGFFFGRTPLIKLSPKKTWEGFIGGGFATVVFGLMAINFDCIIIFTLFKKLFIVVFADIVGALSVPLFCLPDRIQ